MLLKIRPSDIGSVLEKYDVCDCLGHLDKSLPIMLRTGFRYSFDKQEDRRQEQREA